MADPVVELFPQVARVAADRHGKVPVLRVLSRPQRAEGPVSAF
ncbi:MAG: hypothetical protein K0R30_2101 [Ornithinibacter sp.]|jgi:hypothetical protein|nr:hypothetical protein [Ornithinibacter sp.]